MTAPPVKVKPLVWIRRNLTEAQRADTVVGQYEVGLSPWNNGLYPAFIPGRETVWCSSPDAAKAAAQADYEARILSAIDTTDLEAHIGAVLAEAVDACTNVIKNYDVMDPSGAKYAPMKTQKAAKGMVSLAREDIRALHPTALTALDRAKEEAFQRGYEEAAKTMVPISYDGKYVFFDGEGDVGIYRDREIEEIKRQARVEGMRAALEVLDDEGSIGHSYRRIRALIEKESK